MTDRDAADERASTVGTFLRGVAMGAADAVPGVSGGTIALITGIYERLIAAVTAVTGPRVREFPRLLRNDRRGATRLLRDLDVPFLCALGLGILTAVVAVTRVVDRAVTDAPVPTYAFFFGLIAASAVVLFRAIPMHPVGRWLSAVVGVLLALVLSGGRAAPGLDGPLVTFVAGAVAVSAMVLPGVSGSLLLLIMGQYERMVGVLREFVDALVAIPFGGSPVDAFDPGTTAVAFVAGALVGLVSVAHAVKWALRRSRGNTMAFLGGLLVGALRAPGEEIWLGVGPGAGGEVAAITVVAVTGGGLVVLGLDRVAGIRPVE